MAVLYGPLLKNAKMREHPMLHNGQRDPDEGAYEGMMSDATCCTYCGKQMTFPAVYWMSSGEDVWLHPSCAVSWILRLMRDVHEAECVTGRYVTRDPFSVEG